VVKNVKSMAAVPTVSKDPKVWLTIIAMAAAAVASGYEMKASVGMNTLRHETLAKLTERRFNDMEVKVNEIQKVINHLDVIENKINNITRQLNKYSDSVELLNKRTLNPISNGNQ
jgi:hypothetical protein